MLVSIEIDMSPETPASSGTSILKSSLIQEGKFGEPEGMKVALDKFSFMGNPFGKLQV